MAGKNVAEFTSGTWNQEVIESEIPVMVDFWATWCPPCRTLAPIIDKLADQYAGKLKVGKVNVDENPELAARYQVASIPRVMFFRGSDEPLHIVVGAHEDEIINKLESVVGN